MITGLFETHIDVANLERSMAFYEDVLGLELGVKEEGRRLAFYWIGGWGRSALGLWEKPAEQITSRHFAVEIALADMNRAVDDLRSKGLPTTNFFDQATDVPSVFGWIPAVSIYFRDPDGHELEYIAKLPGEPKPELGVIAWDEWQALTARTP